MDQSVKELHEKRSKMWEGSIANHRKYIDDATGIFTDKFTQDRNCPVCDAHNELELFYKEGGRYVKCNECSMVYINPVFTDDALEDYYRTNHDLQGEIVESDTEFYSGLYNKGLDGIEKVLQKRGQILDIGCSSGIFLDTAKGRDWKTFGVELNQTEAKYAQNKGHIVFNDLLHRIDFDTRFDAVSLWDVFEHLKNGEAYLNHLKNLLLPEGVIFLQIPSSDSLAAKILHEKCNMFDGLEHVNLYGVTTIKQLAEKCGLEILSMETVISEIGVINNHLSYENPYFGNTDNKTNIAGLIDETTLHNRLMGYKLQVIMGARK